MTKLGEIQIAFWDRLYPCLIRDENSIEVGEKIVVKTEWGNEIGRVVSLTELKDKDKDNKDFIEFVRKVTTEDLEGLSENQNQRVEAVDFCKKMVDRHNLPMKVIDAHFSFDGSRIIFPFIADGRVDFRQMVKDLTHHFQKSIRLQQIGIRDEAKISGDIGSCGRKLCCKTHLRELESITSDLADIQQVSHRGSERLSGMCGRLRCCLAYEGENYKELAKDLPPIGSKIKTPQGRGEVIGWHILKQTVDVSIEGDSRNVIEFPIKVNKAKE